MSVPPDPSSQVPLSPSSSRSAETPANPAEPSRPRTPSPTSPADVPKPDRHVALPLVDALFQEVGARMDSGEAERQVFGQLADHLWTGSFVFRDCQGPVEQPRAAKERLERMLNKATQVRQTYQDRLCNLGQLTDRDFVRSLEDWETAKIHNAWMNDVASWMTDEALAQYNEFLRLAQELEEAKGKGKQRGKACKPNGSSGKPAMGGGKMGP